MRTNTNPKQLTVRLSEEEAEALGEAIHARGVTSINRLTADLLSEWANTGKGLEGDTRRSLAEGLVAAVTETLRRDVTWAKHAINAASLSIPRESVYYARIGHFHAEKKALAESFVPWLLERINYHIELGKKVILLVESGTTLKALFDELGPRLSKIKLDSWRGRVEIITNNFPGAESYEAHGRESGSESLDTNAGKISDIIPCHLVPGRVLGEYEAVVGPEALDYLTAKTTTSDAVLIGVVVGNWVMLDGSPLRPIPLARGWGHRELKEAVIRASHEVYLISPLCKIFLRALKEFNADFVVPPDEEYRLVDVPTPSRFKLVTTFRGLRTSIVQGHSKTVRRSLCGEQGREDTYDAFVTRQIEDIPHLFFRFDEHSESSEESQKHAEFPHDKTRTEEFLTRYFL
jgi:hypothetical protein